MNGDPATEPAVAGDQERHLAIGTIAQQTAYVVSTLAMLGVITALARTLALPAFGAYGLLVSFATYLLVAQGSVEIAAIKHIAEARDSIDIDRAISATVFLYAVFGLIAGTLVAGVGIAILPVVGVPDDLMTQSREGLLALGVVTFVGWPTKAFQDVLRGTQRFVAAAISEVFAWVAFATLFGALIAFDAPLWMLVAAGGSPPLLVGSAAGVAVVVTRTRFAPRLRLLTRASVREFVAVSGYLLVASGADLVIYSLDRIVLGAFRSTRTIGLYEGPVRAHNVIRQIQGVLSLTIVPAAANLVSEGDRERLRELLLRGTRYVVFATLPITIVFMTLAGPILGAWLGPEFRAGATALTILVGYWLVSANSNVAGSMLVAAGRVRQLAIYAWVVAVLNLGLSLALTPALGLNGVVLGTAVPTVLAFPVFLRMVLKAFPEVGLRDFVTDVWIPAYSTGAALAAALLAARAVASVEGIGPVLLTAALGIAGYWLAIYVVWLRPSERVLARDLVATVVGSVRQLVTR